MYYCSVSLKKCIPHSKLSCDAITAQKSKLKNKLKALSFSLYHSKSNLTSVCPKGSSINDVKKLWIVSDPLSPSSRLLVIMSNKP